MVLLWLLAGCGGAGDREPAATASRETAAAPSAPGPAQAGHLAAAEARGFLAAHPEALVLDVRDPEEWNDDLGHIEGARQIPLAELSGRIGEVEAWRDRPVVTVCRVGVRSQRAAELLAGAGFRRVVNLEGGMAAWRQTEPAPSR
jgi:rhodanese-related sulfurtransferase